MDVEYDMTTKNNGDLVTAVVHGDAQAEMTPKVSEVQKLCNILINKKLQFGYLEDLMKVIQKINT